MNDIFSPINAFAASWSDALVRASWQGGIGIALLWLLCRLWPGMPPSPRCWLWRLAYLKLLLGLILLPPLALPLLPHAPAPPPSARAAAPPVQARLDDVPPPATAPIPLLAALPEPPVSAAPPPRPTQPSVQAWLLAAWLLGALASLGRVLSAWRRAQALFRACTTVADEALRADVADLCRRFGLPRVPPLRVAEDLASPLLLGLGRPTILLPAFVLTGSPRAELRLMLAHELAHLARRDLLWNALPLLAQRLFFFHPLVWLAAQEWSLAQEIACDALAVETTGTPPSAYGRMLLGIATRRRASAASLFPTLAVAAPRHTLRRRLFAMQHIGTLSRLRVLLAAALTLALAVGGLLPWHVVAQSGASVSAPSGITQGDATWEKMLLKQQADIALRNAQLDAQLAEVQKHLAPAQSKTAQTYIRWINADYAANQISVQLSEQQRADYIATHPNSLTNAQIAFVQKVNRDKHNHKHIGKDTQAKLAAIPTKQRDIVAMLRLYDLRIIDERMRALVQKQGNVVQLRAEYGGTKRRHAESFPMQGQGQSVTTKASLPPPQASTASFSAVAVGDPPPLRLAQSGAALSTPPAVTQNEEALQEKLIAEFASRNAQLDARLTAIFKPLSPERQKKAQAGVAFMTAGDAKSRQHIQMLEQHRADYLAANPNRLSDAQIALVQKVNWDRLDPYRINEGIRWEQSIKRRIQAHIDSSHDATSRQGWQAQITAIDQQRRVAERQIRELGPAIAREEAEVAAIPADQRARVTKLRSYDSEISAYKNMALMDKEMRIEILRQQITGTPPTGRQGRTRRQSAPALSHRNANPNTGALHMLPFQSSAPSAKNNLPGNVNRRSADLARRLSDLHRGTSLKSAAQRIARLGGREDGGLQSIPATRYYFSPGIIVEIPAQDGVITGPLRIHPGSFNYD